VYARTHGRLLCLRVSKVTMRVFYIVHTELVVMLYTYARGISLLEAVPSEGWRFKLMSPF
jgi:hypothetical protein